MGDMRQVVLIRHGATEWSELRRHTSHTDLDLTSDGEAEAKALRPALADLRFAAVLVSPRRRAVRTAELAGLTTSAVDPDLAEWDYGAYEGVTTAEIRQTRPDWSLWTDGAPDGESQTEIGQRIDRVVDRIRSTLDSGDVAVVAHGHSLRVLTARWLGLDVDGGALFALDSGSISTLGFEHGRPVILHWNLRPCP
jgi:broad specificity phosphatase PhoE